MHTFVVCELRLLAWTRFQLIFAGTVPPVVRNVRAAFLVLVPEAVFWRNWDILTAVSRD